jgi:hypothetical protein
VPVGVAVGTGRAPSCADTFGRVMPKLINRARANNPINHLMIFILGFIYFLQCSLWCRAMNIKNNIKAVSTSKLGRVYEYTKIVNHLPCLARYRLCS